MSDSLSGLELFKALSSSGSVAQAAKVLQISAPSVSRRLAALEKRLAVTLIERGPRHFRLTAEGELYRDRCDDILAAISQVEEELAASTRGAEGVLRVGAPIELGRRHIAPLVGRFLQRHRKVHAHLALSDMGWEVGRDRVDIALRLGRPEDAQTIARRIAVAPRVLCAAPSYLRARGAPTTPSDLGDHDCLTLERRGSACNEWRFAKDGTKSKVSVAGSLSSASSDVLRQWAVGGLGLSYEVFWDVANDLEGGDLVQCLPDYDTESAELFATYLPTRHLPARVRLFLDFIIDAISSVPTSRRAPLRSVC